MNNKITIFLAEDHKLVRDAWKLTIEDNSRFSIIGEAETGADALMTLTLDLEISEAEDKSVLMIPKFAFEITGKTNGYLINTKYCTGTIQSETGVSFTKDIATDLNLRAIAGWNVNQRTNRQQQVNGTGYVVFNIDDIDNTNNVTPGGGDYARRRLVGA